MNTSYVVHRERCVQIVEVPHIVTSRGEVNAYLHELLRIDPVERATINKLTYSEPGRIHTVVLD